MRLTLFRPSLLIAAALGCLAAQAASLPQTRIPAPAADARISSALFCFARVRGLDPGRMPEAYLVLQLQVRVSYHNRWNRPLIVPLEHSRTIYTAFQPGPMTVFHLPFELMEPSYKEMKHLPADVNPDNPAEPKNDVFTVVPAGGDMKEPIVEDLTLPVDRPVLFHHNPDLRGHRVYIRLDLAHRELSTVLDAVLSDRWAKFGVPWSGVVRTGTFAIDVPQSADAKPCSDSHSDPHP
ncbi:MAG TPA: hypothetical protein VEF06_08455 [Bryobacteraceae bacterium]|nr:hypothetical protein [Bryobacteraceae bacterium]